jgi:hypothetical protein
MNGSLWSAWKAEGGAAVLVRPDGHVGWMGRRPFPDELQIGVRTALGDLGACGRVGVWA